MKRGLIPLTFFLGLGFLYYMTIGFKVDDEEISLEEAPETIRKAIHENTGLTGFRVFQEGPYTYVYYKSNDTRNDYITTSLDMRWKARRMVVTARVNYAVDDSAISYERLIKMDHRSEKEIIFKEKIMSK